MRLIHPVNNEMQISIVYSKYSLFQIYRYLCLSSCMEHALHLVAKHFVEVVDPTGNDTDEEHNNKYDIVDTVGKALALITQVSFFFKFLGTFS